MHPIFYYIGIYLALSALGIHLANKRVETRVRRQRWVKYFSYLAIISIVVLSILYDMFLWVALAIIIVATFELIRANYFLAQKKGHVFVIVALVFAVVTVGFFYFSKLASSSFQLFIYFQVFTFDAFCQICGQLFGKHALSMRISPSKTIEGLVGGVIFCLFSAVLAREWVGLTVIAALEWGTIIALSSLLGDLLASYYKRSIGIKDYSNFLPGQGGFLDRFDSLMMTGAIYFFLGRSFLSLT
jgi:phosphatidate cytidylyltransferase